jgi:hypothetical protein
MKVLAILDDLHRRLNHVQMAEARDQVRVELEAQERGSRALHGYGASTR